MQSGHGLGGIGCSHPTTVLWHGQLKGEVPFSTEVAPPSVQQIKEVAEFPGGAWVARVPICKIGASTTDKVGA